MNRTITAVIPAFNEETNIERCLKSVSWCDKVIVMWMGNDNTESIAKKLGAKVIPMNPSSISNFAAVQKNINWVIDHIKTDWLLRVDADEVVTNELKEEIQNIINTNQKDFPKKEIVAYGIPRSQFFWGGFLKGGDWAYDRLVRLFKPKFCRYEPIVAVHEQFKVNGNIGYLNNRLLHYSHPTLKDAVIKFQRYTDAEIKDIKIPKVIAFIKMCIMPFYVFSRWVIWHKGYRDGLRGLVAGAMRGWYEYLLYSKYLFTSSP